MITKTTKQRYFWLLVAVMLAACQPQVAQEVGTITPNTITATQALETSTLDISTTPLPKFSLDNFRMAYAVDGKLYIQDSTNPPRSLIDTGNDHPSPLFSDDGEKLVFYRGEWGRHSINIDGSQMINLGITAGWHAFIPNTHQLLLNEAYPCQKKEEGAGEICATSFFLVNADTGELKQILSDVFDGGFYPRNNFKISPDGKMISVSKSGEINVYSIDDELIWPKIATYTSSSPEELVPRQYWISDSSGLILILPTDSYAGPKVLNPNYVVWRYKLGRQAAKTLEDNIEPLFSTYGCFESTFVSPDGNWMLHYREPSLYLSDLNSNHTELYSEGCTWLVYWNSDSNYFIYRNDLTEYFLGSTNSPPVPLNMREFIGWYDATHYIYWNENTENEKEIYVAEIDQGKILEYRTGILLPQTATDFTFVIRKLEVEK